MVTGVLTFGVRGTLKMGQHMACLHVRGTPGGTCSVHITLMAAIGENSLMIIIP
jgi:hypothetical protein